MSAGTIESAAADADAAPALWSLQDAGRAGARRPGPPRSL